MAVVLRSPHHIASWLEEPATFKATIDAIHDGAAVLDCALEAIFSPEPPAFAA